MHKSTYVISEYTKKHTMEKYVSFLFIKKPDNFREHPWFNNLAGMLFSS